MFSRPSMKVINRSSWDATLLSYRASSWVQRRCRRWWPPPTWVTSVIHCGWLAAAQPTTTRILQNSTHSPPDLRWGRSWFRKTSKVVQSVRVSWFLLFWFAQSSLYQIRDCPMGSRGTRWQNQEDWILDDNRSDFTQKDKWFKATMFRFQMTSMTFLLSLCWIFLFWGNKRTGNQEREF